MITGSILITDSDDNGLDIDNGFDMITGSILITDSDNNGLDIDNGLR